MAVGFSLACLLFVIDMSRPVVAGRRNGTDYRSKRLRSFPQREVLTQRGRSIAVLELKGALFFGNSHGLASDVQALGEDARFVVLDCRHLRDVDTSGVTTLVQIAGRLRGRRRFLLAAGTNPGWFDGHADLPGREAIRFFPTREAALSWAEDQILAEEAELRGEPLRSGSLILASGAANLFEEAVKSGRLEAVRFGKGEALCKAGDPGDRMWILKSGTVAIFAPGDPGSLFLARLGPGSPVGEMGLMSQTGRAADAVAEKDVEAYLLTEEAFSRILLEEPGLGQTILLLVAKHLADRLRETTEDLKSADSVD